MSIEMLIKGRKKLPLYKALIAIDVSGSVGTDDVKAFLGDIGWLFKRNDARVELVTFDDGITAKYQLKSIHDLEDIKEVIGRGGTSYKAVLDYAVEIEAKEVIIMTDGYGDQNDCQEPPQSLRVWWISTQKEPKFPFGHAFYLDG